MKTCLFIIQYVLVGFCYGAKVSGGRSQECDPSELPLDPTSQCCGVDVTLNSNKIIGGEPTALKQYPWLALVEYSSSHGVSRYFPQVFCGAFLISSRYVVTAAHCVTDSLAHVWKPTAIRLGEYDKTHPGKDCVSLPNGRDCTEAISIPIEKVVAHEHYVFNMTSIANDIALIKLRKPAPYTDHIRPICLPSIDFTVNPPPSLELHVAGWGTMKQIKKPGTFDGYENIDSKIKRFVKIPFINYKKCRKIQRLVTKSHICAGGNGQDSCMGDSGGPLMFNRNGVFEAVGIVSYGPGAPCGMKGVPGVYTKVFSFKDWIMKHIDG